MRNNTVVMTYAIAQSPSAETSEAVIISGPLRGQIVPVAPEQEISQEELLLLKQFVQLQKETGEELDRLSESMQAFNKSMNEKLEALQK